VNKEHKDKLAWTSIRSYFYFVWDSSEPKQMAQEYTYKGTYTYLYTNKAAMN